MENLSIGMDNLVTVNPEQGGQWHPTKNGHLTPAMVAAGNNKKAWWLGSCGHEWQATICGRQSRNGCPFCSNRVVLPGFNDLVTKNSELDVRWRCRKK